MFLADLTNSTDLLLLLLDRSHRQITQIDHSRIETSIGEYAQRKSCGLPIVCPSIEQFSGNLSQPLHDHVELAIVSFNKIK